MNILPRCQVAINEWNQANPHNTISDSCAELGKEVQFWQSKLYLTHNGANYRIVSLNPLQRMLRWCSGGCLYKSTLLKNVVNEYSRDVTKSASLTYRLEKLWIKTYPTEICPLTKNPNVTPIATALEPVQQELRIVPATCQRHARIISPSNIPFDKQIPDVRDIESFPTRGYCIIFTQPSRAIVERFLDYMEREYGHNSKNYENRHDNGSFKMPIMNPGTLGSGSKTINDFVRPFVFFRNEISQPNENGKMKLLPKDTYLYARGVMEDSEYERKLNDNEIVGGFFFSRQIRTEVMEEVNRWAAFTAEGLMQHSFLEQIPFPVLAIVGDYAAYEGPEKEAALVRG